MALDTPDNIFPRLPAHQVADPPLGFPRDHHLRRRLFVEESFHHQAKCNLNLLRWLVARYTKPSDVILDPMAGTGSLLIAAITGRHVVLNELEPHWTDVVIANTQRVHSSNALFGAGAVSILEGDAARLNLESCSVDHVIFSPPYWDTFSDWNITSSGYQGEPGPLGQGYADDRGRRSTERTPDGRPAKNVGNLHVYEEYLRAMRLVYTECWRVLRPNGLCLVLVKDRVHKRRRIPITRDTATLLQALGFHFEHRHDVRWPKSRYRRLYELRHPEAASIDSESVLVFRRPKAPVVEQRTRPPLALITRPKGEYGPGAAPLVLFEKSVEHASRCRHAEISLLEDPLPAASFAERRAWCFDAVADLVAKDQLGSGRKVLLYVPARYAPYLVQRLQTLDCPAEHPTAGMNMGRKLAWLTREIESASQTP